MVENCSNSWGLLNGIIGLMHTAYWISDEIISFGVNTPRHWHNTFKVNWFGATIIYIITSIFYITWSIGSLIYLLFTVGRKK